MNKILLILVTTFSLSFAVFAQTNMSASTTTVKKSPIFRANKEQIMQAQKMLQVTESGKLDTATRAAIKTYQGSNGLKATGTLNRATLEKMNITLTEKQMLIPVSPNSFASTDTTSKSATPKKKGPIFRADKDQIMQAQKMMKDKSMYSGAETGKLDTATRAGLKKFQGENGIKVTGTLNKETLEKMGITLTDKQKAM